MSEKHTWVLWGYHPKYANGVPIKLTGGHTVASLRAEEKYRNKTGWLTAIYKAGVTPQGLLDSVPSIGQ